MQANESRLVFNWKVHMSKTQIYRSLIAAAVIGALWYFLVLSQATELHPKTPGTEAQTAVEAV
jgi:hypothetical protein